MKIQVNFLKKISYCFLFLLLFSSSAYGKQDSLKLEVKQDTIDKNRTGIDTTHIPNGIMIEDHDKGYKLIQMKGEEKSFLEENSMLIIVFGLLLLITILVLRLRRIKGQSKNDLPSSYTISKKEVVTFSERANTLMTKEQLFLNTELSLKVFSKEMNLSDKKLSYFLNEHLKTNFYDYINDFRLQKFVKNLEEGKLENYSVLGLATACGFKSKTVFYRAFKKKFKCSPSEYLAKSKK